MEFQHHAQGVTIIYLATTLRLRLPCFGAAGAFVEFGWVWGWVAGAAVIGAEALQEQGVVEAEGVELIVSLIIYKFRFVIVGCSYKAVRSSGPFGMGRANPLRHFTSNCK